MRYVVLALLTVPTIVLLAGVFVAILTGQSIGLPVFFSIFPLLGFVIGMALIFVFPDSKESRIAAAINAIPLILVLLVSVFFWLVGYNG